MSPSERIPHDIRELVSVTIKKESTSKRKFNLEELKDLQSKLALIRGKLEDKDISTMAETFWKVCRFFISNNSAYNYQIL